MRKMMDGISKSNYTDKQIVSTIYELITNIQDLTVKAEIFDNTEYNFLDRKNNLMVLKPDYENTDWYVNAISPLLYTNNDVTKVVSGLTPPTNDTVVTIGRMSVNRDLSSTEVETVTFTARNAYGSICNTISKSINTDFYNTKVYLANYVTNNACTIGIEKLLSTSNLPSVTPGNYPILAKYKLPGKNHVTHTKQINIEYQY